LKKTRNTAATLSENEIVSTHLQEIEKFLTERWIETRAENRLAPVLIDALIPQEKSRHSRGTFSICPGVGVNQQRGMRARRPFVIFLTAIRNTITPALTAL